MVHPECIYPQVASPKLWIRKPQSTFSGWWFQPNQKDTVSWSQFLITNGKHQHTWNRKQVLSSLHLYGITLLSFWRFHSYVYLLFLLIRNWSKFYTPHAAWFHSHPIQKLPPSSNQTRQRKVPPKKWWEHVGTSSINGGFSSKRCLSTVMKNLWRLRRFQELSMVKDDMAYGHPSHHGNPFSRHIYIWSVVSTPLKNMKVSWDYYSKYMGKTCSKKTHTYIYIYIHLFLDPTNGLMIIPKERCK